MNNAPDAYSEAKRQRAQAKKEKQAALKAALKAYSDATAEAVKNGTKRPNVNEFLNRVNWR